MPGIRQNYTVKGRFMGTSLNADGGHYFIAITWSWNRFSTVTLCVCRWVSGWEPCLTTWNTSHAISSPLILMPSWCQPTSQLWTQLTNSCQGRTDSGDLRSAVQMWNYWFYGLTCCSQLKSSTSTCPVLLEQLISHRPVWTVSSRMAPALSVTWRWAQFRCVVSDASLPSPHFLPKSRTFPIASVQSQARRSSAASHCLQVGYINRHLVVSAWIQH